MGFKLVKGFLTCFFIEIFANYTFCIIKIHPLVENSVENVNNLYFLARKTEVFHIFLPLWINSCLTKVSITIR